MTVDISREKIAKNNLYDFENNTYGISTRLSFNFVTDIEYLTASGSPPGRREKFIGGVREFLNEHRHEIKNRVHGASFPANFEGSPSDFLINNIYKGLQLEPIGLTRPESYKIPFKNWINQKIKVAEINIYFTGRPSILVLEGFHNLNQKQQKEVLETTRKFKGVRKIFREED